MTKQEIYDQITGAMGFVPGWLKAMDGAQLEHAWGMNAWFMSDTKLSARDKALVAFGAASANHCRY